MVSEWLIETKVEYTGGREGGGGYAMLHLDHFFSKRGVNGEGGGCFVQYSNTAKHSCHSLQVLEKEYIPNITTVM